MNSTFRLRRGLRLAMFGQIYEIDQFIGPEQLRLVNIANGEALSKNKYELLMAVGQNTVQVLEDMGKSIARTVTSETLDLLPLDVRDEVKRRFEYVRALEIANIHKYTKELLQPIIMATAAKLRDARPPSHITLYRWTRELKRSGSVKALMRFDSNKGNKSPRHDDIIYKLIDKKINEVYLTTQRQPILAVVNAVNVELIKNQLYGPTRSVTYNMVYGQIKKLDPYEVDKARYGKKFADHKYQVSEPWERPTQVLQRAEIDHTRLDLFVIDEESGMVYGRPTLTIALDGYSRAILGYFISYEPPSALAVLSCLNHAIWMKTDLREKYPDIRNEWTMAGVPETLVVDNGKDFTGTNLEAACLELGTRIEYCPVQKPWYKGMVERFFRTINQQLIHRIPGTTFSNIKDKGDYDPKKHAIVTFEFLQWLVNKWVVDIYHQRRRRGCPQTPTQLWAESVAEFEPRYITNREVLDTVLAYTDERTVGRQGIQLDSLFYSSPDISHLTSVKTESGKFPIKYNPMNLGRIRVFDPSNRKWIEVPSINPEYTEGLSVYQHHMHQEYARQKWARDTVRELLMAREEIRQKVNEAAERVKKTGAGAKIARYFQLGFGKTKFKRFPTNGKLTTKERKDDSPSNQKTAETMVRKRKQHQEGLAELKSEVRSTQDLRLVNTKPKASVVDDFNYSDAKYDVISVKGIRSEE